MLRSLLGAARRYSFFSLSLPSLFSPSISSAIFFLPVSSFSVLLCLLSRFSFSRFFLLIRSVYLSSPSFSALLPSLPLRHPLELGLVVPSGNGYPTYTCRRVRRSRTHMRGPLLRAVEGKEGQQVDACIRVSNNTGICIICTYVHARVRVYVPSVRPSKFSVRGKDRSFYRNYCYPRGSSNLRVVNSPLMHDPAQTNLACERVWMHRYQYIAQMIRIKGNTRLYYYGIHVFSSPPVAVIFFLFLFFFFDKLSLSLSLQSVSPIHVENVNTRCI